MATAVKEWLGNEKDIDLSRFTLLGNLHLSDSEVSAQLSEARAPNALKELKRRIVEMARAFSQNYKLKVLPSTDGKWALGIDPTAHEAVRDLYAEKRTTLLDLPREAFTPTAIFYNLDDIALAPEETVYRRVRHEALRAQFVDYRYLFEGFNFAKKSGAVPSSFGLLHLAVEEARVYQREVGDSASAKETLREALTPRLQEIEARINQQPLMHQLALNLVYGKWLTGEHLSTLKDPSVRARTDEIYETFQRYIFSDHQEDNFKSLRDEIWPKVKGLEGETLQDEILRELAKDVAEVQLKGVKYEQRFTTRIINGVRRALWMKPKRFAPKEDEGTLSKVTEKHGGELLRKEVAHALAQQKKETELVRENLIQKKAETVFLRDALELFRINEPALDSLTDIYQDLPVHYRSTLTERARASIQTSQDAAFGRELPIGFEMITPSDQEHAYPHFRLPPPAEELAAREVDLQELLSETGEEELATVFPEPDEKQTARENARRIQEELRKRRLHSEGFTEEERQDYENFKALEQSVIGRLPEFLQQLRPLLPKKRTWAFSDELHYTGVRLDRRALTKKAPVGDMRVRQRREAIDSPDPRMFVTLVIDNSASMEGQKIHEAKKTALFWARALKEMNVPFAIKLFGSDLINLKNFNQDYDDPITRIKPDLVRLADASMTDSDIGQPLEQTENDMGRAGHSLKGFFGAIFVISDSGANKGMVQEELQAYIRQLQKKYLVMNFILTDEPQDIQDARYYFGNNYVVAPRKFQDLTGESIKVLRSVLREASKRNGGVRY